MNTQKSVYKRLFSKKTELETHKIELSLLDDAKKKYNLIMKIKEKAEKSLSKAKFDAVIIETEADEFAKEVSNIEKIAKDLGISPKDMNLQKLFQDVKEAKKLASEILSA